MKRYISDLHFFHDSLNRRMDCRGFESAEALNAYMAERWNQNVSRKDEVYILGDLALAKGEAVNRLLRNLNGKLYLLIGNHDGYFLNDRAFDASRFEWIRPYAEIHDNQRKVILCHYPVFCYNGQNRLTDAGKPRTYMLYGHVHDTMDERLVNQFIGITRRTVRGAVPVSEVQAGDAEAVPETAPGAAPEPSPSLGSRGPIPCNMINCFCMFSDYVPLPLDSWIEIDEKRRAALAAQGS